MVHVRSDRWYDLPADRAAVWDSFTSTRRYRAWWPWLTEFDGVELAAGQQWSCTVSPPLPYLVRFRLELVEVDPPRSVRAVLTGDVVGNARLEVVVAGSASRVHLVSDLAPGNPALQVIARVAQPVVRRGHDWVLDTGARQFVERALDPTGRI